jgi:hypothetical protein
MKLSRIGVVAAAVLVAALATFAQADQKTPEQWTIVTTQESAPNAYPLFDANGNPYSCNGVNPDNSNDSNPNCYNPLVITTDWTVTSESGIATNVTPVPANTFTNSSCSALGGVTSISVGGYDISGFYQAIVTVVLDNGATLTFTGDPSEDGNQFSGTFHSTGACMKNDSGTFTATLFPTVNGTYSGSFENSKGGPSANGSITFKTDSNFNVTGTVSPAKSANMCFSTLTIGTPLANTYEPSIASGDFLIAIASDSAGNVVGFVASGTDANGEMLPDNGLSVSYQGLAGACSGITGTDVLFKRVKSAPAPKHHHPHRG